MAQWLQDPSSLYYYEKKKKSYYKGLKAKWVKEAGVVVYFK